jgi:hypothetical protein
MQKEIRKMEKWQMLEGYLERQDELIGEQIAFIPMAIEEPRSAKGIAFPESEFSRIRAFLGLSGNYQEVLTNQEGVTLLQKRVIKITPNGENLEQWDQIELVLREYAEKMKIWSILVSNPHGHAYESKTEEGKLFIRFWSAPVTNGEKLCLAHAFGYVVGDSQHDAMVPSGQGITISDDEGNAIAEVVGGTLYVLFDLPHPGTPAGPIMEAIMERWMSMQLPSEERDRFLAEQAKLERERSRLAYIAECGKRLQVSEDAAKKEIEGSVKNQGEYSQKLTEAIRVEQEARRMLEQVAETKKSIEPRFGEEFDRLLMVPGVIRVTVSSSKVTTGLFSGSTKTGVISVFTEHLFTQELSDHTIRDLGEYRIDIHTNGSGIRIYNLTREIDDHPHPHHAGDHKPCLGNIQEGIAKLVASYEFSIVAQIMLQFLQTINEQDTYGKRVFQWPVKGSEVSAAVGKSKSRFGSFFDIDDDEFGEEDEYVSQ